MRHFGVIFLYCISLISCTKDAELNYSLKKHRLVLDCTFTDNTPIVAYVTTNSFILDTLSHPVDNASVILLENEQIKDTLLHIGEGKYCSTYLPQEGKCYSLIVEAKGYDSVYAKDTLPKYGFDVTNIEFKPNVITIEDVRFDLLSLDISDYSATDDCFELLLLNKLKTQDKHPYIDLFYLSNPVVSIKNWDAPLMKTILFTDKIFNISTTHFNIYVHNNGEAPIVKLRKISKQYFNFKNSLYLHLYNQMTERDDIEDLFKGDPIDIFSNIQNGYGIFTSFIELEK